MQMTLSKTQKECVSQLEKAIGIRFKNKEHILTAFTHSSYANEHKCQSNERLEFLGDSVLGLIISERLYGDEKLSAEGRLSQMRSRIVSEEPLAQLCQSVGLEKLLMVGVGESKTTPSRAMMADLVEAVIGAVYQDQGFKVAKKFVLKYFEPMVIKTENEKQVSDTKSALQEKCFKQGVKYKTVSSGEAHQLLFKSEVYVGGKLAGTGEGSSKRSAEKAAAGAAIVNLEKKMPKNRVKNAQKYGKKYTKNTKKSKTEGKNS